MSTLKAFQPAQRLRKKVRRGFRGYPVATIAFYGPDDRRASKVAVGILLAAGAGSGRAAALGINRRGCT